MYFLEIIHIEYQLFEQFSKCSLHLMAFVLQIQQNVIFNFKIENLCRYSTQYIY